MNLSFPVILFERNDLAKGGLKLAGSSSWGATRKYYLKSGFAKPNQPLHHWLIQQNGRLGKHVPNVIKNQMWNLMPMRSAAFHTSVHGKGINAFNTIEKIYYGTPVWFQTGVVSTMGHTSLLID
jgi:hypothetical protein